MADAHDSKSCIERCEGSEGDRHDADRARRQGSRAARGGPRRREDDAREGVRDRARLLRRRIQFTPDLLPADITGTYVLAARRRRFSSTPARSSRTSSSPTRSTVRRPRRNRALEAMQERQVTIEGDRFELPLPFMVLATQNPIDLEGTYPLPEAQIDRFLVRLDGLSDRAGRDADAPCARSRAAGDSPRAERVGRDRDAGIGHAFTWRTTCSTTPWPSRRSRGPSARRARSEPARDAGPGAGLEGLGARQRARVRHPRTTCAPWRPPCSRTASS